MKTSPVTLVVLTIAWAAGSPAAPIEEGSTCVSCHLEEEAGLTEGVLEAGDTLRVEFAFSAPTHEWKDSIHAVHEVSCDGCHGGDPFEPDEDLSMSEEAGFLENPSWTEMGEFCGVCHEEVAASYASGTFGRGMDEGVRVATCDTCHMGDGHRILVSQPEELLATDRCPSCLPVEDGEELARSLAELRALHAAVAARVGDVQAKGFEFADVAGELVGLRASIANTVHTFEPMTIRDANAEARDLYRVLDAKAEAAEEQLAARRSSGLVLLGALALLFVAVLGWDLSQRGAR